MIRTFVAIDIDEKDIVSKLTEIQRALTKTSASLKLVEPENIHITLYFLGEIPEPSLRYVREIVEECITGVPKFAITIGGVGAFPTPKRPRVIWVGITKNAETIESIASCLYKNFPRRGFRAETKKFHAHITLARVKRYTPQLKDVIHRLSSIEIGEFLVEQVKVKKSTLTSRGPIYEDLFVFPLS